jgi:hypothetical protein
MGLDSLSTVDVDAEDDNGGKVAVKLRDESLDGKSRGMGGRAEPRGGNRPVARTGRNQGSDWCSSSEPVPDSSDTQDGCDC